MIPLNQQSAIRVVFLLTAILIFSYPLAAQLPVGLRAGISADPDQFFFGGHVESEPLIQTVRFRPSVEGGFGDHRTLLALNAEFVYPFDLDNDYTAYLSAGPAINVISINRDRPDPISDTRVEPGFNFLGGLEFPNNMFAELRVGLIDSPGVRVGFGYTFR